MLVKCEAYTVIPVLKRLRQQKCRKFEFNLRYEMKHLKSQATQKSKILCRVTAIL